MPTYTCTDGNADMEIEADGPREAAEEYAEAYDAESSTYWVTVYVTEEGLDERESIKVAVEPRAPKCSDGTREHDWTDDHDLVGGDERNPGVWANGGGVRIHHACRACGCGMIRDTWAQDPVDGQQGLESVRYEADMYSERVAQDEQADA